MKLLAGIHNFYMGQGDILDFIYPMYEINKKKTLLNCRLRAINIEVGVTQMSMWNKNIKGKNHV